MDSNLIDGLDILDLELYSTIDNFGRPYDLAYLVTRDDDSHLTFALYNITLLE